MLLELTRVGLESVPIDRYRPLLDAVHWEGFERSMKEFATAVQGRSVWNLNSTATGGGVAELLSALIPYERGSGIDARWAVIEGSAPFFNFTKRLHSLLHGVADEGFAISAEERAEYETT